MGAGVGVLVLQVLAAEVLMSGSFNAVFLEPSYRLEVEALQRREYASDAQAEAAYRRELADARAALLRSLPGAARFLADAAARGVSIVPFQPGLPPIPVRTTAELAALEPTAFPLTVSLPAPESELTRQTVALTLGAAVPKAQGGWLLGASKALALPPSARETEPATSPDDRFLVDPAASRLGAYFGLSVAVLGQVRPEALPALQARLDRSLEPLFASLAARLPDGASVKKVAELSKAGAVKGRLDGGAEGLHALFNHHGPLYDTLARERVEVGFVQAVVLFAPAKVDPNEERPPSEFLQWLRRSLAETVEPHAAAATTELRFHELQFGDSSRRLAALDELQTARSARLVGRLEAILREKSDQASLQEAAAGALARWEGPEVRRIFLDVATRRSPRGVLSTAAQALARSPDPEVARALLGVWRDRSLEWNDRYPARDALRTLLPALKGPAQLLQEIQKALEED